ncbi:MAG TPA: HDOD domain-containing protein [Burkholderiales bacterium]|nr:HDOD domain-containing protein [Burkholderiales bacterium]
MQNPEFVRKFAAAAEKMPAFPESVQKILELSKNIDCSPRQIASVVESDPVMTAKVLKALNSPYYPLPGKITSIDRAIVYLGFNTVKNLALGIASIGMLPRQNRAGFHMRQYLLHSLYVAGIAKLLCSRVHPEADSSDCHIAGLLHDFGKVVFARHMAEEFRLALERSKNENISLHDAEREILGADHCLMGSILAEKWQLPASIVETMRYHHETGFHGSGILDCVAAANHICKKHGLGFSGNPCIGEAPASGLDISADDIEKIREETALFLKLGGHS